MASFHIFIGCSVAGMYGESCDEACPINCRDNLCDIETGACLNCNEGFKGEQCDGKRERERERERERGERERERKVGWRSVIICHNRWRTITLF